MTALSSGDPTSIGRYELGASLGVGGFATVYRAYDPALTGEVAIKVLLPHFADNAEIRKRFLQEARLLRRVDSRNLVKVYDLGEIEDGRPYFVMELADGGALADRIEGTADTESIAQVIDALANALGALHGASIVHRDLKPDNLLIAGASTSSGTRIGDVLIRPGERLLVGDLGLAKDQDRTSAGPTVTGGTPFYRPPEQMIAGTEITVAADVYAATAVLWFLLTGSDPPDTHAVPAHITSMPGPWQPVLERGLQHDPTLRFATIAEWATAARNAVAASPASQMATVRIGQSTDLCPYKGMAAFQPEDAGLFFGRDDLVDTLVARVQSHAVTVIGGASGSGKSSLLRAGLLPRLSRGAIAGSQQWRVALFNPGSDAVGELVHQLSRLKLALPDTAGASEHRPSDQPLDRRDLPHGARRSLDDGSSTLLAIDQFEEVFTLNPHRADQELFLQTLASMTESEHSRIRVVVAMRADFYGVSAVFPWLNERINENQILVGPMPRQGLRDAITVPAQRAGINLEAGLADTILDDFGSGSDALPLLGHALMETWIRRRGSQMTLEGYRSAGGVSGAIAQRADDVISQLSTEEQATARRLLLQLITPGEGTPDTRRRLPRPVLDTDPGLAAVAETLASARLLTVDEQAIEVAHEALIRSWPRLRTWIDENREALQTRRRITTAATEWSASDRSADLLYRGTQLAAALDWLQAHQDELDDEGSAFLSTSQAARDQAEEQRAASEARSRRDRRWAVGVLGVLTAAALMASVIAFANLQRSRASGRTAEEQQVLALSAAAAANADDQSILATALALESMARSDLPIAPARAALVEARVGVDHNRWLPQPFGALIAVGDSRSIAITPDGSRFMTGEFGGDVVTWDRESRTIMQRTENAHERSISSLAISPDGRWMVSSGRFQVKLWDLSAEVPEPQPLYRTEADNDNNIWASAFSPDGTQVGVATESQGVSVIDRATGARVSHMAGGDLISVAFLDNERLIVGDGAGQLRIVDSRSGLRIGEVINANDTNNDIWGLLVDPDSSLLMTSSTDNIVRSWRIGPDGLDLVAETSDPTIVDPKGLVTTRDGAEVVVGSADGLLYRADPLTGELIADGASARLHTDALAGLAASDNGWMVSLADDQQVQVWRSIEQAAMVNNELARTEPATDLALSPSSALLASATHSGTTVLRANSGEVLNELKGSHDSVRFVGDRLVVTGSDTGQVQLWDANVGLVVGENTGHNGEPIRALAVSDDGSYVVSGGNDGSLVVWSGTDLQRLKALPAHEGSVTAVDFAPDDRTVISVGWDQQMRFASVDNDDTRSLAIGIDGPQAMAVHPDRELLAVGGSTEQVDIMTFEGTVLNSMAPHRGGVWDVQFSADGLSLIASSRNPGEVRLWDWESGERLGPAFGAAVEREPGTATETKEADVVVAPDGTIWWSALDGAIRRLDVLNVAVGCEVSDGVMDDTLVNRFLSRDALVSCG